MASSWVSVSVVPAHPLYRFPLTNSFAMLSLDLNEAVPETERLDSKALKTRAQLSVKNRRQRPTRTRLYDSVSSTDGEDSLERKVSALMAVRRCGLALSANGHGSHFTDLRLTWKEVEQFMSLSPKFVFSLLYGCHLNPFLHSVR